MTDIKPWYLSKTIWGGLIAAGASLAGIAGMPIDPVLQGELTDTLFQAVSAVGALIAIVGRLSAHQRLR